MLNQKPLKPRLESDITIAHIERLSIESNNNGDTFLLIYPNHIIINSRDLLTLIDKKSSFLIIDENIYIQRQEILTSIYNFVVLSSYKDTVEPRTIYSRYQMNRPKRPTNCYLIFNNTHRKKIRSLFPYFSNGDLSKIVGAMWNDVSKEAKEIYIKQAVECKKIHKDMFPDFKYNVKRDNVHSKYSNENNGLVSYWDDYFNGILGNNSTESYSGVLYENLGPQNQSKINWSINDNFETESRTLLPIYSQENISWDYVIDFVSSLNFEDSDQTNDMNYHLFDYFRSQ